MKLRQVKVLQGQSKQLAHNVRRIGVTVRTYYRSRADTCLIYETADSKIYYALVTDAGTANCDLKVNAIDTSSFLENLLKIQISN